MRNRYIGYGIILVILLIILAILLSNKALEKRNLERKETLMGMMIGIGRHYVSEQKRLNIENPGFPNITNRAKSWELLKPLVAPYMEEFPEHFEEVDGKEASIFSYVSSGPSIGPPGTCFVLEVLLEGDKEKTNMPPAFEKAGCMDNNDKLCFFRSGIYTSSQDNRTYYRIVGGGC